MKTIVAFVFATLIALPTAQAKDVHAKPLLIGLQAENRDLQALAPGDAAAPAFTPSFRSAGSCGGDHAEALIGPRGAVIGYSCSTASANGG